MIKIRFDAEDSTISQDITLYQLSYRLFFNNQEDTYDSSKIRHLIDNVAYPSISLKTYDTHIKSLNEKLNEEIYFQNPANIDVKHGFSASPLHTQVFYRRLYIYLTSIKQNLFDERTANTDQREHLERMDSFLKPRIQQYGGGDYITCQPHNTLTLMPYDYSFNIKNFKMAPLCSPLFVGLVGSISKENDWKNLKKNSLELASEFYRNEYQEFTEDISLNQDKLKELCAYCQDVLFPDELYELTLKFDQIIQETYGTFAFDLRHNLYLLAESFPNIRLITRTGQKNFYQHVSNTVGDYYNSYPHNSNINIFDEFNSAWETIAHFEKDLLSKNDSQNNTQNDSELKN